MNAFTRPIAGLMAAILLTSTACGNLAVPAPFEETRNGWDIRAGVRVEIVTKDGRRVVGAVEGVTPAGLRVAGDWVPRSEIASMAFVRDKNRVFLTIVPMLFVAGAAFLAYYVLTREDDSKRPPVHW